MYVQPNAITWAHLRQFFFRLTFLSPFAGDMQPSAKSADGGELQLQHKKKPFPFLPFDVDWPNDIFHTTNSLATTFQ